MAASYLETMLILMVEYDVAGSENNTALTLGSFNSEQLPIWWDSMGSIHARARDLATVADLGWELTRSDLLECSRLSRQSPYNRDD